MEFKKLYIPENHVELSKEIMNQRSKYGLHKIDTWSLDRYLSIVISNSLKMLAENTHAFPGVEPFDDPDSWTQALLYYSESFRLYAEFDDRSSDNHDSIHWPEEDLDNDSVELLFDRINNPSPEYSSAMNKWIELDNKDYELTKERMNEAFDWLKKWWPALWD